MDILGLYNAGYGMEEIADALGITLRTVDDKLRDLGLEPDYPVSESLWDTYRKKSQLFDTSLVMNQKSLLIRHGPKKTIKSMNCFSPLNGLKRQHS